MEAPEAPGTGYYENNSKSKEEDNIDIGNICRHVKSKHPHELSKEDFGFAEPATASKKTNRSYLKKVQENEAHQYGPVKGAQTRWTYDSKVIRDGQELAGRTERETH